SSAATHTLPMPAARVDKMMASRVIAVFLFRGPQGPSRGILAEERGVRGMGRKTGALVRHPSILRRGRRGKLRLKTNGFGTVFMASFDKNRSW
ncbi:MAG: hypothetical protein ABWY08_00475, partial [Comamonas sp.]